MTLNFNYSNITIKVMRDGDGDGKCQEENGEWVPCPPGTPTGTRLRNGKPLGPKLGETLTPSGGTQSRGNASDGPAAPPVDRASYLAERRQKAAERAEKIMKEARSDNTDFQRRSARAWGHDTYNFEESDGYLNVESMWEEMNPAPDSDDFEDEDEYDEAMSDWEAQRDEEVAQIISENRMETESQASDHLKEIFERTFVGLDGKEYRVELDDVQMTDDGNYRMSGTITDLETGEPAGEFSREFTYSRGEPYVYHDFLEVYSDYQKTGIASKFNGGNEELYSLMGFKKIETYGVSDTGRYKGATHWPRNGFDWRDEAERREFLNVIEGAVKAGDASAFTDEAERQMLLEMLAEARNQSMGDRDRLTAADFLHWPGAEKAFKKVDAKISYIRRIP